LINEEKKEEIQVKNKRKPNNKDEQEDEHKRENIKVNSMIMLTIKSL
jgi:hypothetical protein